jgi:hypothetical protein
MRHSVICIVVDVRHSVLCILVMCVIQLTVLK